MRSARRHTVRATCSDAPAGEPPARMNRRKRRHVRFELVDPAFQPRDVLAGDGRLLDPVGDRAPRIRQPRTDGEEIPLNPLDHRLELAADGARTHEAQPRVELVDVAVGGDARIGLRDALSTKQGGFAAVAGPGVDFHSPIIGAFPQVSSYGDLIDESCSARPGMTKRTAKRPAPHTSPCRQTDSDSDAACSSGIAGMGGTCRGARPGTRTTSSCPR